VDNKTLFAIYFAGLAAMTIHPGFNKPDTPKPTLDELADLAMQMVERTRELG